MGVWCDGVVWCDACGRRRYSESEGHLLVVLLQVLQEEVVIEEFLDVDAVGGVLLEALIKEVAGLPANEDIGGDGDLILYDLYQLLLAGDLEGVLAHQHLVHHDAQRPDVDLLVVLLPLQDLGTDVERGPAESSAQFVVLVDGPPEVAELDDVLGVGRSTSWMTMFSGLMSRWMMRREWISLMASQICLMMGATLASCMGSVRFSWWKSCPPVPTSRMM
jgi:hypothetical protein